MKNPRCPNCGNQQTALTHDIPVDLVLAPAWWPNDVAWRPERLGSVDRLNCFTCGFERETWNPSAPTS